MQIALAGTDTGVESTANRVEIFFAWRQSRRLIRQLLNSGNS
jgi:hypothetical protein